MRALHHMRAMLAGLILAAATTGAALPQSVATSLIADRVNARPDGVLIAEGNVEVLMGDRMLRAERVTFDNTTGALTLEGPLVLSQGEDAVILADGAELSGEFRDGLIRSARLVIAQQLQIAAAEINRVDGRYTQLYRTVASTCTICASNPVPIWQIRARKVIHDQQEQQLYFENATLELGGVPVFYLPRLRLPDPTLRRASGFLVPSLRTTNTLGTGLTVPYFISLGENRDLTVKPYVTTSGSATLGLQYRHAFRNGEIDVIGAYTFDDVLDERGFIQARGRFDLPRNFTLSFDLEDVSDAGYYRDYGLPSTDRIDSSVTVTRVRRDQLIEAKGTFYTSFRAGDDNQLIPRLVGDAEFVHRFSPAGLGGTGELVLASYGHQRPSSADVIGRDMARASVDLDWKRSWTARSGVLTTVSAGVGADLYAISQDSTTAAATNRVLPRGAVELRWPLVSRQSGKTHVFEPILQLVWSAADPRAVPNEDSIFTELDETNLFSTNLFAGRDRVEQGWRANVGFNWTTVSNDGWRLGVTAGRVLSATPNPDATAASGFSTDVSDWLNTVRLDLAGGLHLINRAQYDDQFSFTKNALVFGWSDEDWNVASTYTWLKADSVEGRPLDSNELVLSSNYYFDNDWSAAFNWQYDLSASSSRKAGLGLSYKTDCLKVDFSVQREFTSTTILQPITDFGLTISLDGFGTGGRPKRDGRACQS